MTRAGKSGYGTMICQRQNFRSIDIPFAMYFAVSFNQGMFLEHQDPKRTTFRLLLVLFQWDFYH